MHLTYKVRAWWTGRIRATANVVLRLINEYLEPKWLCGRNNNTYYLNTHYSLQALCLPGVWPLVISIADFIGYLLFSWKKLIKNTVQRAWNNVLLWLGECLLFVIISHVSFDWKVVKPEHAKFVFEWLHIHTYQTIRQILNFKATQ
jgi:hypothetical protein